MADKRIREATERLEKLIAEAKHRRRFPKGASGTEADMAAVLAYEAGIKEGRRLERERILKLRVKPGLSPSGDWFRGWTAALRVYRQRIRETSKE